jgi:DNA-binding CsgD family transcriptional regulator
VLRAPAQNELIRPRLTARFQAAASDRVVLVVAPAGYGKSIALRQYLDTCAEPFVRFNVRAEHRTLLGFARGFADAFSGIARNLSETLVDAYAGVQAQPDAGAHLAEWAYQYIDNFEGIVAIDDLHLAQDDPQTVEFLKHLVRNCTSAQWLLCTRSSAGLPLGEWSIAGYMTVPVDEHELCFTTDEARDVSHVLNAAADDAAVAELVTVTRGWPTALAFALRSSIYANDVRKLAAVTRDVMYRYLSEHVYESIPPAHRELLHHIAYMPRIDLDVLANAGFPAAGRMLEELRLRVTFISVDHAGHYRCHDLFVEFLQQRVEMEGAAARGIRLNISGALEQTNRIADALRLYAATGAEEQILRLLASHGLSLLDTGYTDAVDEAIVTLGAKTRRESAIVLALRGMREATAGRFDRAEELLRRSLTSSNDQDAALAIGVRLAIVLLNAGCDARPLLSSLESIAVDPVWQAEVFSLSAAAHARLDDAIFARKYIALSERLLQSIGDEAVLAKVCQRLAVASIDIEMPYEKVMPFATLAEELSVKNGLHSLTGNVYAMLGNLAIYYFEDLDSQTNYARKIAEFANGERLSRRHALLWDVLRVCFSGDEARANIVIGELSRYKTSDIVRTSLEVPLHAMLLAWQGRLSDACLRLKTVLGDGHFKFAWDRAFWASAHAVMCAGSAEREEAKISLEIARAESDRSYTLLFKRRIMQRAALLCAIAELLLGRISVGERMIRGNVPTDPKGMALHRLAHEVCASLRGRCADVEKALQALDDAGFGGFKKMLITALEHHGFFDVRFADAPKLTRAEVAVLEALARGQSPKEIAAETGRSVHTVRTLAQRAAEKLGCSGRQQAIAVARSRGLIGA